MEKYRSPPSSSSLAYAALDSQEEDTGGSFLSFTPWINQTRHHHQSCTCLDWSFILQTSLSTLMGPQRAQSITQALHF